MSRWFAVFLITLGWCPSSAQVPTVTQKFDALYIGENFDSINQYWTTLSNIDNLLIVQEGEYIMHRKAAFSPYAVLANFPEALHNYRLVSSLKLDKVSAEEGSIGLIFMAQQDGSGGFIFEINKKEQYRLRQIAGKSYKYLTGSAENNGWVSNTALKGLGLPNLVELRIADDNYDLFINNHLVQSFNDASYASGAVGFLIGPASKGKADFIYIFTTSQSELTLQDDSAATTPDADIIALAESIITLKTQINRLEEQNTDLKGIIEGYKMASKESDDKNDALKNEIMNLKSQLKAEAASFDSLNKANSELIKYKEMVKGNDNGDLVINLSKNLKNEKLANEKLLESNKMLLDSIAVLTTILKGGKPVNTEKQEEEKKSASPDAPRSNTEFILPGEN